MTENEKKTSLFEFLLGEKPARSDLLDLRPWSKEDLLALKPRHLGVRSNLLTSEETMHIAEVLGSIWRYDYCALAEGKPGYHALLKSGLHSDGFFDSYIMLGHENILEIMAYWLSFYLRNLRVLVDYVAGIPNGATKLGEKISQKLSFQDPEPLLKKEGNEIVLAKPIPSGSRVLLVEDCFTRGTAFRQASRVLVEAKAIVLPILLAVMNRNKRLRQGWTPDQKLRVIYLADFTAKAWKPRECPLCKAGSIAVKPKENWKLLWH